MPGVSSSKSPAWQKPVQGDCSSSPTAKNINTLWTVSEAVEKLLPLHAELETAWHVRGETGLTVGKVLHNSCGAVRA